MDERPGRSRAATLLLVAAIVGVALNQRPAIVAVGSVLRELQDDTGLGDTMAGVLTAVPVLCFGAFAPVAPRLARRIGLESAVALSLVLLVVGISLRLLTPVALLYAGALIAGAAIALANVLLPAYVKREFPRPGAVMGAYSSSLNVGAALGAAITLPLGRALGLDWRGALGLWLVLAVVALALWLPVAGTGRANRRAGPALATGSWSLLRQPLARQVTAYLGLQSVEFYSFAAWLPALLHDSAHMSLAAGGALLGVSNITGAAAALVAPAQAGRMRTQRPLIAGVVLAYALGLGGLLLAPATALLWVCLFGVAQGGGFALALTLIVLRSPTPLASARLGGVAQCLGYLMAAAGPLLLGALREGTGGWVWPVVLLLALLVPMGWYGWGAARDAVLVTDDAPAAVPAA
jgi:MFS transporter, CP family, cyanate transporter